MNVNQLFVRTLMPVMLLVSACNGSGNYPVHSHVEGTFSVRSEIDSTRNYANFRVSVLGQKEGNVDTLGTALTGADGSFVMDVHAPEPGVYPISVDRGEGELAMGEFVAVDGDSVRVSATFPLGARRLRIVSPENAAWTAYRNAKVQHNYAMAELIGAGDYTADMMERVITQTSTVLWNIQSTYPETIGGNLAKAESVIMMEGWNDSLVVARLREIAPSNASMVEVARAARRSIARLEGGAASLRYLTQLVDEVPEGMRAGILAEAVVAYADSNAATEAVEAATELRRNYPDSPWAQWAIRATYDLENLQPGMEAPAFALVDRGGQSLTSSSLSGRFVILEFFDPLEPIFQREMAVRDYLAGTIPEALFQYVSVSVEADEAVNQALFEEGDRPGLFVFSDEGIQQQIVQDFNVHIMPTRFLIDPDGRIVARYTGPALDDLESDLITIINSVNELADRLPQRP